MNHNWGILPLGMLACVSVSVAAQVPANRLVQSADEGAAESGIQDIVVTAQRRAESVQKSALAIQVLSQDALTRVTQARDLNESVPGLQIGVGGNTPQTFIRGVGAFSSDAGVQSAVTFNLDGVVISDPASVIPMFYDLQRVEVLKGPQGTLYGRNSSAGAINLITNRPIIGERSGYVAFDVGNYDRLQGAGAVNLPVGAAISVRAAFNIITRDGYLSDDGDDDKQRSGRLQILFDDNGPFTFLVGSDFEKRDGKGGSAILIPGLPGRGKFAELTDISPAEYANIVFPALRPIALGPGSGFDFTGLNAASPKVVQNNNNIMVDNEQWGVFAEANYDFGPIVATLIPAYRHSRNIVQSYTPGLPFAENLETKQKSMELRLAHDSERLKAVGGLFYLDFDQLDDFDTALYLVRQSSYKNRANTRSYAAFAQGTYSLSDSFRATAGVRYTQERRSLDGVNINANRLAGIADTVTYGRSRKFNNVSYRGGLEYDLGPNNMLYATVSRGFKSGGFNSAGGADSYDPEKIMAYTGGIRNRFFDNNVQLNVEAFYWDVTGSQQTKFGFTSTGELGFLTVNATDAKSYGGEADLVWQVTPNDTIRIQGAYLETKFGTFTYDVPAIVALPGSIGCPATPILGGAALRVNCSGLPLPRSPKWSGNAGYDHVFDLANGGSLTVGGDLSFATSRWLAVDYVSSELAKGYVRYNAQATWKAGDSGLSVTAYIQNITNEENAVGGLQTPATPNVVAATVMAPRTYGVRLRATF